MISEDVSIEYILKLLTCCATKELSQYGQIKKEP